MDEEEEERKLQTQGVDEAQASPSDRIAKDPNSYIDYGTARRRQVSGEVDGSKESQVDGVPRTDSAERPKCAIQ